MSEEKVINIEGDLPAEALDKISAMLDETGTEETDKYVMAELFRGEKRDLFFKTDLNTLNIQGIVRLLTIDRIMKAQSMNDNVKAQQIIDSVPEYMTTLLMKLLVSKDRKGRLEFIKAWIGNTTIGEEGAFKWLRK